MTTKKSVKKLSDPQRAALDLAFGHDTTLELDPDDDASISPRTVASLVKRGLLVEDEEADYPCFEPVDLRELAAALGYAIPATDDVVEAFVQAIETVYDESGVEASRGVEFGVFEDEDEGVEVDFREALAVTQWGPSGAWGDRDEEERRLSCVTTLLRLAGFAGEVEYDGEYTMLWPAEE